MAIFEAERTLARAGRRLAAAGVAAVAIGCLGTDDGPTARVPGTRSDSIVERAVAAPLVGSNYTHHSFAGCSWNGNGILRTYVASGVEDDVHQQLREMRRAGAESLRHIVWHMRDVAGQRWGVVPSRGGRLPEPFRSNLIAYLTQVHGAGFRRLTISFSPQWTNSPLRDNYAATHFEENWAFIQDIRGLAVEHGPADVRFDLLNEGAPSDHAPQQQRARMAEYVRRMWRRYTDTFGVGDVTVSVIAPEGRHDRGHRLQNLLTIVEESGAPLPTWFELHLNYHPAGVSWGLSYADSVLGARGLAQPLTIGETSYNDAAVAQAIRAFMDGSDRPLGEVTQWFRRAGAACEVSPPYEVDAFLTLRRATEESHRGAAVSNSSSSSSLASARISELGWSFSDPSGAGLSPELLMR
jgi:hypothetical protein